jgi:hypothetical protein
MSSEKEKLQGTSPGVTDLCEVATVVAADLEVLSRSRDYLAQLIQCGDARSACQPEHPELACDRELLGRLDACHFRLVREQSQLEERWSELLREARTNSPFCCPQDVELQLTNFEALQAHANNRSLQGLLTVSKRCQEGRLLIEQLKECIHRLAINERRCLETAAREFADQLAYPHTPFWYSKRNEYLNGHAADWHSVSDRIKADLQQAYAERREMEARHDEALGRKVGSLLTLPTAAVEARKLAVETHVTRDREDAALKAVQQVWRGTQKLRRWAYRRPVELGENDRLLAMSWVGGDLGDSYRVGAMKSARCAESVALDLYRDLHGQAEDLSILQLLLPSDSRWQTADIATAGG